MKTLNTIQTISKIGKILSKIIYICCIIGVAGCIVGMVSIPFADTGVLKIGGVTISGLIVNRARIELAGLYPLLTGAMIVCIGQCITAKFAELFLSTSCQQVPPSPCPVQRNCCGSEFSPSVCPLAP